jgi:hypothetical protein
VVSFTLRPLYPGWNILCSISLHSHDFEIVRLEEYLISEFGRTNHTILWTENVTFREWIAEELHFWPCKTLKCTTPVADAFTACSDTSTLMWRCSRRYTVIFLYFLYIILFHITTVNTLEMYTHWSRAIHLMLLHSTGSLPVLTYTYRDGGLGGQLHWLSVCDIHVFLSETVHF